MATVKCPQCDKMVKKRGLSAHVWRAHTPEGREASSRAGLNFKGAGKGRKAKTKRQKPPRKKVDRRTLQRAARVAPVYGIVRCCPRCKLDLEPVALAMGFTEGQ